MRRVRILLRWFRPWIAPIALVAAFALFLRADLSHPSYKACKADYQEANRAQQRQEVSQTFFGPLEIVWDCTGAFVHAAHDELIGIGTLLLAVFTTTLWFATQGLLWHGREIERAYVNGGLGGRD